ncbi:50S ribosomal protein L2 [candidate division WWE3 bacterium RIFOXYC1_FULL_40_10]|uniref:50S ribosomal protein L2 n=1 Tax=candidate division WWE3 bacterium RIFOXYA2_FULL_46_9 TaxID=1802636 RepID=A0A1F4VYJ2_UNCKA|nr:MAG: 50S ribosomal protein L2 [candidate division WWE3 bacterium RIFOXYB1_FULL_40_22]OGC61866.1 MAG: 50S ribosomal protein L2 [candidate division WWE3 bacterium RIFOXYA1_FULL_40_11]OGC62232.1 MAG: 50S ribosomal protein L2 [candidate division WWE3 bacterium RIFOXYA2_FULL_46_9]OGC64338.1 MAG: 50S ribosomal protein L2 [candidate division WWE3 bacterium RIFOXYB2_FULL_41_6]OGC66249.1 MAG: 50S ribosomal protein L2 [candidate division WWE3 bacterium RIFOXYC1_FULL_40_10]OGC67855.1 MAG: 50S ribosoma
MIKTYKPTSSGQRKRRTLVYSVDKVRPLKSKTRAIVGTAGRNNGTVSVRHKERGARRLYRQVDFKREKFNIPARVSTIEYDPNRGPNIALLVYADGEKRYILAPEGLEKDMVVVSGTEVEPKVGNTLPLSKIPLGMPIHNIELNPGAGAKIVRGAGNSAQVLSKEAGVVLVRLPSKEVKKIKEGCLATIGTLGNPDLRNIRLGKAGRKRHIGVRPAVRGVAMANPKKDHPHAGKYSKTGIGMKSPKSPWGWITRGVRSRKRKYTDYTIVKRRYEK